MTEAAEHGHDNQNYDEMDAALKELDKLQQLTSDSPSTGKSKTPAIQDSLNSLLQTLHAQKKRLEAGIASEAELATLAKTVESRKKEIDERQKEIYNSLARYGKALDKVCSAFWCYRVRVNGQRHNRDLRHHFQHMNLCSHRRTRRSHWSMSLPFICLGRGGFLRQRHSFRCVIASRVTTDTTLNLKTKEFGVDLPAGRQSQFVELYRILMALRNKDIEPALEYVPPL